MKFTRDKREIAYSILIEKMSEFWSEVASEFPEANASMISQYNQDSGKGFIVNQVESWYESTSATDPAQCASVLERMIEDGEKHMRNQRWSAPDGLGKGTLQLLVQKDKLKGVRLGGLFRCLRENLNELNRELAQIDQWDIDSYDIPQMDEYFLFTRIQIESFKRANKGLLVTFSYKGYDNY
jgi:hypothetical protein